MSRPCDQRPLHRRWRVSALAALLVGTGCTTQDQLAAQLERAVQQQYLPGLQACWEKEFESAGFVGEYEAVVDFTVEGGSGTVRDAVVHEVRPADESLADHADISDRLEHCLVDALDGASLAKGGMKPTRTVYVRGFRLAFVDASSEARQAAADRAPTILIGPRADRCEGLYSHEPPRQAAELVAELAKAQAAVERLDVSDRDGRARALQRTFDVALELRDSLINEARREDLSPASRKRTRQERDRALGIARRTGAAIGCEVPKPTN